jgi:hypothetical protein
MGQLEPPDLHIQCTYIYTVHVKDGICPNVKESPKKGGSTLYDKKQNVANVVISNEKCQREYDKTLIRNK